MNSSSFVLLIAASICVFVSGCSEHVNVANRNQLLNRAEYALLAWQNENWEQMYSVLSSDDKFETSLSDFIAKRSQIAKSRSLTGFEIAEIPIRTNAGIFVSVTLYMSEDYNARLDSKLEDKLATVNTKWFFVKEDGNYFLTFLGNEAVQNSDLVE